MTMADFANLRLALPLSGANGGTVFPNYGLSYEPGLTVGAGATTSTAQSKYYGSALHLNSNAHRLSYSTGMGIGTSDFCVSLWIRPTSLDALNVIASSILSGTGTNYFSMYLDTTGELVCQTRNTAGTQYFAKFAAGTISINNWYFIEFGRASGQLYCSVDGVIGGTSQSDSAFSLTSTAFALGFFGLQSNVYHGRFFANDLLFKVGEGPHTSNFTPPDQIVSTISGNVLDRNGDPFEGSVMAIPRSGQASRAFCGTTDASGDYSINVVSGYEYSRVAVADDTTPLLNDLVDRVIVP
jgi:hypothetical protein